MPGLWCRNIGTSQMAGRPQDEGSGRGRAGPDGLTGLAAAALIAIATAVLSPSDAAAADTVIKRFTNGTSRDAVGMIEAREDAPMDGPQAIYAAEDGSLYLLDQVNGRLLRFDSKKADGPVQSLELPEEMRPTDVVVRRGNVYVWDGAPQPLPPTRRA